MSSHAPEKKIPLIPGLLAGLVLMFVGMYLSTSKPSFLAWEESLVKMGFPVDLGKSVAVIGVFLILFPVINMYYIKPLLEAMQHRSSELEATFGEAESLRSQMTQLKTDYEARLAQTEADARAQIQAQVKEAQETKKTLVAEAAAKVEDMKRAAETEIESQKKQVIGQLRVHVATLSLQASEKILKENVDTDRNRKIIDDFLATVEVRN